MSTLQRLHHLRLLWIAIGLLPLGCTKTETQQLSFVQTVGLLAYFDRHAPPPFHIYVCADPSIVENLPEIIRECPIPNKQGAYYVMACHGGSSTVEFLYSELSRFPSGTLRGQDLDDAHAIFVALGILEHRGVRGASTLIDSLYLNGLPPNSQFEWHHSPSTALLTSNEETQVRAILAMAFAGRTNLQDRVDQLMSQIENEKSRAVVKRRTRASTLGNYQSAFVRAQRMPVSEDELNTLEMIGRELISSLKMKLDVQPSKAVLTP